MTEVLTGNPETKYITQTPEQRADDVNRRGFGVVSSVSQNLESLVDSGIMVETSGELENRAGQRKFVLAETGIPGGWRQVGRLEGARVTLVQPDAPNTAGYLTVETTGLINGGIEPSVSRPENVRVDIDAAFKPHVSGVGEGSWNYDVDRPNPNLFGQEFNTAASMLGRAEGIVESLVSQAQQPAQ